MACRSEKLVDAPLIFFQAKDFFSEVMKHPHLLNPDTKADTKRYACNASYASDAVYKPLNSDISRWCRSSLTPVAGKKLSALFLQKIGCILGAKNALMPCHAELLTMGWKSL